MKGTPPISVTSAILEWSQEMKRKKCGFLPTQLIPFFKVTDDEEGKNRQRISALVTLDSSPGPVRGENFVLKLNSYFIFSFFLFIFFSFTSSTSQETAINNRTYFGDFGSEKNLAFVPLGLFIYIKCVLFSIYVILVFDISSSGVSTYAWNGLCYWKAERNALESPSKMLRVNGELICTFQPCVKMIIFYYPIILVCEDLRHLSTSRNLPVMKECPILLSTNRWHQNPFSSSLLFKNHWQRAFSFWDFIFYHGWRFKSTKLSFYYFRADYPIYLFFKIYFIEV